MNLDELNSINRKEASVPSAANSSFQNTTLQTDYTLTGDEGDPIDLMTARKWVKSYQKNQPQQGTVAHFFGYQLISRILAEDGCVGIRMYYALDDQGNRQLILVGVDKKGNDLVPSSLTLNPTESRIVGDASFPCPSFCSPTEF
jgi:hypothetical protein